MDNYISQEIIEKFLNGEDDEKYIVNIEYDYKTNSIYKVIQDPKYGKTIKKDTFIAFLWVGDLSEFNFYNKDKNLQKHKMQENGIVITPLKTYGNERLEKGQKHLVKSLKGYSNLISFFKQGGIDPWGEKYKNYFTILNPVEQYLIQKKKRFFKGFENYDDIDRLVFDIETTGLNPEENEIILIGIKTNRGFKILLDTNGEDGEKKCIELFFQIIKDLSPTIIGGYNSASFDFPFILKRAEILNIDINKHTSLFFNQPIKKKEGILKLASEIETYNQYIIWGANVVDISHSVRRAQAINSEIKSWSLKYVTKFLEKEKPNRVYVDGSLISKIYNENENYYINPKTGKFKKVGEPGTERLLERYPNSYELWTGQKIIEQYLDDDLFETMVVDESFSQSTFLLSKLVPTKYERVSTMGTATLWKIIMLEWSYNNDLAIPQKSEKREYTGGLSRLLSVGFSKNVVKFDFSSLYPSIQLVYNVFPECDVMHVQKSMLKYFRDIRIKYKGLTQEYEKTNPELSEMYDRKQLPIKIFINAYFGSISAPSVFPWGDIDKGESITCIGRQFLRMMIMYFQKKGYLPLVMDSVEYDTPVYLKDYNDNLHILPICDLFDEHSEILSPDGLRDFSEKGFTILTKSGWKNINYVYRHETNKTIHKIVTKDRLVCCTSDHSIFQNDIKVKPTNLKRGDNIDIYEVPLLKNENNMTKEKAKLIGFFIGDGSSTYKKRNKKYHSKKEGIKTYKSMSGVFTLNNSRFVILKEFIEVIKNEYGVETKILNTMFSSGVYKLQTSNAKLCKWFSENCYTSYRQKMIPHEILNSTPEIMKAFMDGFYLADGWGDDFNKPVEITQKSKVCVAGLVFLLNKLNINFKINIRKDKPNIQSLIFGTFSHKYYPLNNTKSNRKSDEIWFNEEYANKEQYVYDISTEDGSFIGGIGGVVLSNTDGVNFEIPKNREDYTYIGKGNNDLVKKDKEYKGVEADVAEFNDIFMKNEMGLDIDYFSPATINVTRKNYIIKMNKKGKEKIKLTGNTIKSKKIPQYVSEFLDEGFKLLLNGDGHGFVELYYSHVNKIFNKEIPLSKIANKGRVKQKPEEYKKYILKTNKAGALMARQAHMELIILNEYPATLGETIYFVNNGTRKGDGDVQKKTEYLKKYTRKELEEYQIVHGKLPEKETSVHINCYMITEKKLNENPDLIGEYNVPKYLANFNKRISPLMVVFSPEIRDSILIEDPKDRQYFTKKQLELVSGYPLKEKGQDNLNEVLTLSDTEVLFWNKMKLDPYFMYDEENFKFIDKKWVDYNRSILDEHNLTIKNNEDETIDISNEEEYDIFSIIHG